MKVIVRDELLVVVEAHADHLEVVRPGGQTELIPYDEPTLIAFQRFYSLAGLWKRLKPSEFYYQGRYPMKGRQPA